MKRSVYYDNYEVGEDSDGNPIYDTTLSHKQLVGRAKAATGLKNVISIDWYDEWTDMTNPDKPVKRVRAKVIMG